MRIALIRRLIDLLEESEVEELELTSWWGWKIRLSKSNSRNNSGGLVTPMRHATGEGGELAHLARPDSASKIESSAESTGVIPTAEPASEANLHTVTSPMVATFYRSPAPEAPHYVQVGSRVKVGQTLCILEAMKLMNELESEVKGVIREICVEDGEPVEFGQHLFRIEVE